MCDTKNAFLNHIGYIISSGLDLSLSLLIFRFHSCVREDLHAVPSILIQARLAKAKTEQAIPYQLFFFNIVYDYNELQQV